MSFISWFSVSKRRQPSTMNKSSRQPRRQPTYARPTLEYLEERALLDATSGLIGGASNNLALSSNFSLASNGVVLPTPGFSTGAANANGANPSNSLNFSGLTTSGTSAQAATSAFLSQGQLNGQFRLFAVNSQGANFQLFQQAELNFLSNSYGFGSGSQPNAPWKPNAYNLGLANHQFNSSSQSDSGSQSVPPWTVPVAQAQPKDQLSDEDGTAREEPDQVLAQKSSPEQEETLQKRVNDDTFDMNKDGKALLEQSSSEKQRLADEALMQPDASIPDTVWLSALAPAPLAAVVTGFPAEQAVGESSDAGDGGGE